MSEQGLREELVTVARQLNTSGLNQGTSGNLSVRIPGGVLITPSSLPYEQMQPADLVALDLQGRPLQDNGRRPSSEWRLHVDVLAARAMCKWSSTAIPSMARPSPATTAAFRPFTT